MICTKSASCPKNLSILFPPFINNGDLRIRRPTAQLADSSGSLRRNQCLQRWLFAGPNQSEYLPLLLCRNLKNIFVPPSRCVIIAADYRLRHARSRTSGPRKGTYGELFDSTGVWGFQFGVLAMEAWTTGSFAADMP